MSTARPLPQTGLYTQKSTSFSAWFTSFIYHPYLGPSKAPFKVSDNLSGIAVYVVLYFDTAHSDSYRKELVALFDKLDSGELTEGPELAELITNIHKRRY